jgi:HEAT repeat protein
MSEIFISYCRKDADPAELLRGRLKEAGFSTWIDLEGLQAGEEWGQEIDQAIRDSAALVVLLTPASRASAYVAYEWAFALGAGVRVIPILWTSTDIPHRLASLQHLDFTDPGSRPWASLIGALEDAVASVPTQAIRVDRTAPALVKQAALALDSPELGVMQHAMRRLAEMRTREAEAVLVQALTHPLPDVRIEAAGHLANRGDVRAVPGLLEGNRERGWHMELGRRLRAIGSAALPALREALGDPSAWIRRDLVWAMRAIGDPAAVPDLVRRLDDPDAEVREAAIRALGEMGGSEGVQALVDFLPRAGEEEWLLAIEALQELGTGPAWNAVLSAEPRLMQELRKLGRGTLDQARMSRGDRIAAILNGLDSNTAKSAAQEWNLAVRPGSRSDHRG